MRLSPARLDAVLAPFVAARPLPANVYVDPDIFAFERSVIFDTAWLNAGRASDLAPPRTWARPPLPRDVLLARAEDGEVRAFYNACRHRAACLVDEARGEHTRFTCPYHGWSYDLRGRLVDAPHAPPQVDHASLGLVGLEASIWNDFVFCRAARPHHDAARSLVADAPPWLRTTDLRSLVRAHCAEWETLANWKLIVENFQESHHFERVHRSLEALTPNDEARSVLGDGAWLGGTMRIRDGAETVSASGERHGRPFVVAPALRGRVHDALLFPGWLTSLQPDYFLSYRLVPLAVDRTRVCFDIFVHENAPREGEPLTDLTTFWERINAEDRAICESQQRCITSTGLGPACFATVEDGVHAFQQRVARAYAREVAS